MLENLFGKFNTKNIMFFIAIILCIVLTGKMQDIAIMFFASYVIACSLEPVIQIFGKKYKRDIACLLTLLCVLLIICAFVVPLIVLAGYQISNFANSFPNYMDNLLVFIKSL